MNIKNIVKVYFKIFLLALIFFVFFTPIHEWKVIITLTFFSSTVSIAIVILWELLFPTDDINRKE